MMRVDKRLSWQLNSEQGDETRWRIFLDAPANDIGQWLSFSILPHKAYAVIGRYPSMRCGSFTRGPIVLCRAFLALLQGIPNCWQSFVFGKEALDLVPIAPAN